MKDYSKVKYVKYLQGECSYLTKDKVYKVLRTYVKNRCLEIESNLQDSAAITVNSECLHLGDGGYWIPCDENGKEIEL